MLAELYPLQVLLMSEQVTAMAGDKDVVLQLKEGGTIQGKLVDATTGDSIRGIWECVHAEG